MVRDKFKQNYEFIKNNIYLCNSDLNLKGAKYNSALLLGMLSAVQNKKTLYVGEYGLGKTTLAETISGVVNSLPISIIATASIKGHPELSHEQLIGRPDLGRLNQGVEKVVWSDFVQVPAKVIDEVNRIPESKQNVLLSGMQSDTWSFLNDYYISEEGSWFATANYKDSGNYSIIPPLLDRFDICLESKSPDINISRILRSAHQSQLDNRNLLAQYKSILNTDDFQTGIDEIKHNFYQIVKQSVGLDLLTQDDKLKIQDEINSIGLKTESNLFFDLLLSEFTSCMHYGHKRSTDTCPSGCHYNTYACNQISSPASVRTQKAILSYAKSLAWISGDKEVGVNHISTVAPYTVWHKSFLKDSHLNKNNQSKREEPLALHLSSELVRDINKRFKQVKSHQEEMINYIINKEYSKAESKAKTMDHPVFSQYVK